MVKRHILFILTALLSMFYVVVSGQQSKIDSLENLLRSAPEDTNKVNTLNRLCRQYRMQSEFGKAVSIAEQALALANKLNFQRGKFFALRNMGVNIGYLGNLPEALKYHLSGLRIAEEMRDKKFIADSYHNIGSVYENLGDSRKSLDYYLKALKIREEIHDLSGISYTSNNLGIIYQNQGKYKEALQYYLKSAKMDEELGDVKGVADSKSNAALVYRQLGLYAEAKSTLMACLQTYTEQEAPNEIANCNLNLGELFLEMKDIAQAKKYFLSALSLSKELGINDAIKDSYAGLFRVDSAQGHWLQAFENHKLFMSYRDSLLNEDNTKRLVQVQMQYDFDRKEAEVQAEQERKDAVVKQGIQRQKFILWSVLGGLFLVVVFSVFIFNRWRITQRQKKIIQEQKILVEKKNNNITDSISYAKRIQEAILPKNDFISDLFPESFIFFRPQAIVSGDFYWFGQKDGKIVFAAIDCTGHGVPGAFMSMIGNTLLNEIVNEKGVVLADEILNRLKSGVIQSLKQSDDADSHHDGMDISLCVLDRQRGILEFAGANNPLYYFRNGELTIYPGTPMTVGFEHEKTAPFVKHSIQTRPGDMIYLFSDGFPDQRGGIRKHKYYYKPFQQLLTSISHMPANEQIARLSREFDEWKGNIEQIDDVLVIGIRL